MGAQSPWADIVQGARLDRCEIWFAAVVTNFHRQFLWRDEHREIDALRRITMVAVLNDIGTGFMHCQDDIPSALLKLRPASRLPRNPWSTQR